MIETKAPTFLEIAEDLLARGFSVIPLLPQSKDPHTSLATSGAKSRTRNVDVVRAWASQNPNGNVGVCADENITILESDDEERFREVIRKVSREMYGTARELPDTLTSQARAGRPHWFYGQTALTRARVNSPGIAGMYEWRHYNEYVVGAGSTHPGGMPYMIVKDLPIAPMADWLVEILDEVKKAYRGQRSSASAFVKVGPAGILIDALKNKYSFDSNALLADDDFKLTVDAGERHYFLMSVAGLLWDGDIEDYAFQDILRRLADKFCVAGHEKGDREIKRIVDDVMRKTPCTVGEHGFWNGLKWFLSRGEYENSFPEPEPVSTVDKLDTMLPTLAPAIEVVSTPEEGSEEPAKLEYPRVWGGTLYDDFAQMCRKGNFIPYEFLLESIKTIMGAVMGKNVRVQGEYGELDGAVPRFYTVMIADGQGGKGTSIDYAMEVFEEKTDGLVIETSPLWPGEMDPSSVGWVGCGASRTWFNSVPGLGQVSNQPRILQDYGELSLLMNAVGNEVAGDGLLAVLRDLYDGTRYGVGATAKRKPLSGRVEHSLLAGTTPELWRTMFSKKQVAGSGLFQRFNLVPVERTQRSTLHRPNFNKIRDSFRDVLNGINAEPVILHASRASLKLLDEWFEPFNNNPDLKADDFGRLNVLALRNSLHLTFMRGKLEIGIREMEDALKLSDYQFQARQKWLPASGFNDYALVEDEVRIAVRAAKRMSFRELKRQLRKYGKKAIDFAVTNLDADGEIIVEEVTPPKGGPTVKYLKWTKSK